MSVAALTRSAKTDGPIDFLRRVFRTAEPTTYSGHPEEGRRLVRAFLKIESPERRQAVLQYVEEMARIDEAERDPRN